MAHTLEIIDLHAEVEGKEIIRGLTLTVKPGELHALMGPNGSGKSTLAFALMGHPKYRVTSGDIRLGGQSVLDVTPDERAKLGLFLGFQYPFEIPGVKLASFLRTAYEATHPDNSSLGVSEFYALMNAQMGSLQIDQSLADRALNEGFSGGEKKRAEILQMAMLKPSVAVLDEPDSGLDIDGVRMVAEAVNAQKSAELGILVITHYQRILKYLKPDFVHVLLDGKIVRSGGKDLAALLEEKGYDWIKTEVAA